MKSFALAILLMASSAGAISHIGSSFVFDKELGFEARWPGDFFLRAESQAPEGMVLAVSQQLVSHGQVNANVLIMNANVILPDQKNWSRKKTQEELLALGFRQVNSPDPCIDVYHHTGRDTVDNQAISTAFWAEGRGVALGADRNAFAVKNITNLISTIKLTPGACQW